MTDDYSYTLIGGRYRLHQGDAPVAAGALLDAISLAIDLSTGALLKHGHPIMINEFFNSHRARLRTSCPMAPNLFGVLTGRIPIAEVNKCLLDAAHAKHVWEMALAGTLAQEPVKAGVPV